MAGVETRTYTPENFYAGDFPIAKDVGIIKSGVTVRKWAPIVRGDTGIEEATSLNIADIIGIAADESNEEEVVYYLTGEFFANKIVLPDGVTIDKLKAALRKIGIFLK